MFSQKQWTTVRHIAEAVFRVYAARHGFEDVYSFKRGHAKLARRLWIQSMHKAIEVYFS